MVLWTGAQASILPNRAKAFEKIIFGPGIWISCTGRQQHPRVRLSLRKAA
jgi:hypothetical protein